MTFESKVAASACGTLLVAALASVTASAQTAGAPTSPQQPGRQLADTPPPRPNGSGVTVQVPRQAFVGGDIKVRPAGFRVTGSTVFTAEQLQAQLSEFRGKDLDFNALADIAAKLRRFYVDAGYPLTDVYFPEQSFAAAGGTIEFAVIEARIGKVEVVVAPELRVRADFVRSLVEQHLKPGQLITQQGLDRPVLLLRDLPGTAATANVTAGAEPGRADVTVTLAPQGRRTSSSVGFDNFGSESVGRYRFTLSGSIDNVTGYGDTTNVAIQPSFTSQSKDDSATLLYRLGHRFSVGPYGTKLNLSYSHSKYQLGGTFAALNASGDAKILSAAFVHPVIRSRASNVFFLAGADFKRLLDRAGGADPSERDVRAGKFGLIGNSSGKGFTLGGTTNYSVLLNTGSLDIRDAFTRQQDATSTGLGTQGGFRKLNIELQRVEYLSEALTLFGSFAGQSASKNLTSAEKLALTGPAAIRGYPADSGTVVDEGWVISLELRRRLGINPFGAAFDISAFYDYGAGSLFHTRSATVNSGAVGQPNRVKIDSVGVSASLGIEDDFFVKATLARLGGRQTFTGSDPSKSQFWLSAVKAF